MASTRTTVEGDWEACHTDISALSIIQIDPLTYSSTGAIVELLPASTTPSAGDIGLLLMVGDALLSDAIPDLGTAGALYARSKGGRVSITCIEAVTA